MKKIVLSALLGTLSFTGYSQLGEGSLTGNIESTFQFLGEDTLIDANQPPERGLLNAYMNVFYTNEGFKAGMRLESYLPSIQGYPGNFSGTGLGMRYIGYSNDFVDVTLGSIYEQFGAGLSLRTYEDRALGYDNFLDGARVILRPYKGVKIKGVYGYQRVGFIDGKIDHGPGIVRGADAEVNLNSVIPAMEGKKLNVTVGGSIVSKYQKDNREDLILPENVGAYGGRLSMRYGKFTMSTEYIHKINDPSADNGEIYNVGHAAVVNLGFSQKGLGIMFTAKSVDNMSFRSDRNESLQNALINFLPAMNKVHTYNLVSSLYPWATQPTGEIAFQGEVLYTVKRGTPVGGKYGTTINVNTSMAFRPDRKSIDYVGFDSTRTPYTVQPFAVSDSLYWRDVNITIAKKFSKKFNVKLSYYNITMNNDINKISNFAHGFIQSNIAVVELGYKFNRKHSLRVELQGLTTNKVTEHYDVISGGDTTQVTETVLNDKGNWVTALIEYNVSPHWFFSIMDQYNLNTGINSAYNYRDEARQIGIHHVYASVGYVKGSTRLTFGYGRQRAGLFCVGGICRTVPASNGLTISFTQSF